MVWPPRSSKLRTFAHTVLLSARPTTDGLTKCACVTHMSGEVCLWNGVVEDTTPPFFFPVYSARARATRAHPRPVSIARPQTAPPVFRPETHTPRPSPLKAGTFVMTFMMLCMNLPCMPKCGKAVQVGCFWIFAPPLSFFLFYFFLAWHCSVSVDSNAKSVRLTFFLVL